MPMEMIDASHIEDRFATTTRLEDAGGGCIRIYNCIEKGGILIPVGNAVVFPISCILQLAESAQIFARMIANVHIEGQRVH